jgi:hypothetical protein
VIRPFFAGCAGGVEGISVASYTFSDRSAGRGEGGEEKEEEGRGEVNAAVKIVQAGDKLPAIANGVVANRTFV